MKKLVLIAAAFMCLVPAAFAQKGLHAGFKVAPISTWMFNSDDSDEGGLFDYRSTIGYTLGATVNYHITDGFGLGADILYSSQGQGYKSKNPITGDFENGMRSLKYLKIPVLIHFNTSSDAVAYFQGYLGPQFGVLLSAEDELPIVNTTLNTKDAYESMNISFVLGFGAGFNVHENFKIHVGLRLDGSPFDAENKDSDYWLTQLGGANREKTRNVTGGIELGLIYVLPID